MIISTVQISHLHKNRKVNVIIGDRQSAALQVCKASLGPPTAAASTRTCHSGLSQSFLPLLHPTPLQNNINIETTTPGGSRLRTSCLLRVSSSLGRQRTTSGPTNSKRPSNVRHPSLLKFRALQTSRSFRRDYERSPEHSLSDLSGWERVVWSRQISIL